MALELASRRQKNKQGWLTEDMMRRSYRICVRMLGIFACAVCSLVGASAQAALLNLGPSPPDITATDLQIKYTASSDEFQVWGIASSFELTQNGAPPDFSIAGGELNILFEVNNAGELQPGGTLIVTGAIGSPLNAGSPLLTADIKKFGYQGPGEITGDVAQGARVFELEFATTGGSLAQYFQGIGGVVLTTPSIDFAGHFNSNFQNFVEIFGSISSSGGTANIYAEVPEPASLLMWSAIGLGLVSFRKLRERLYREAAGSA